MSETETETKAETFSPERLYLIGERIRELIQLDPVVQYLIPDGTQIEFIFKEEGSAKQYRRIETK